MSTLNGNCTCSVMFNWGTSLLFFIPQHFGSRWHSLLLLGLGCSSNFFPHPPLLLASDHVYILMYIVISRSNPIPASDQLSLGHLCIRFQHWLWCTWVYSPFRFFRKHPFYSRACSYAIKNLMVLSNVSFAVAFAIFHHHKHDG